MTTILSPLGCGQDDSASINAAIKTAQASGGTIYLSPGLFTIASSIWIEGSSVTIQGSGPSTILRRLHNAADYWDALFSSQNGVPNLRFADFTVDGSQTTTAPLLLNAWGVCTGVDVGRIAFNEATAPLARQVTNLSGMVVHDCRLNRSSALIGGGQTYNNVTWTGASTVTNECILTASNITLSHLEFIGTDRGIVCQGASNVTASWLRFIDISGGLNSGELILSENAGGTGLSNSNFSYVTAIGCDSAVITDAGTTSMTGNTFTHINQCGGRGILLGGASTGNNFSDVELRFGGVVWLYPTAQNNSFDGLAIISPVYSQGNERYYVPSTPFMAPLQAIIGAAGNKFTANVTVQGLPAGWVSGL